MKEEKLTLSYLGDSERRGFLYHEFDICVGNTPVGECYLKEGERSRIMTLGNVGYRIEEEHRGHSYAAKALKLLADIAPSYNIDRLVICCLPENIASARSCEKAGAVFDRVVELTEKDESYAYGTRSVKRYFIDTPKNNENRERKNKMKIPFKVDLSDKIVAVTGGGGVLMSEFARALAECGARVAILDIDYMAAKSVSDSIGENAFAIHTDCLDKGSVENAHNEITKKWGKVNLLINGAGGNAKDATCDNEYMHPGLSCDTKSFFDLDCEKLKFVFDLNITSAFIVTQVFAADMVESGGNIINISSMNAYRPLTKIPAYSAAKAGVSNFTQWLAVHFAPCNIRVNAIAPGFFVTKQNRDLLFDADGKATPRTEKILSSTPLERFGRPEELIGTLLYLACDSASSFVTGSVIAVDGGFNAYSGV